MKAVAAILAISLLSITIQSFTILPWWSYLIAIFCFGIIFPFKKNNLPSFMLGFASGFISWVLPTMYFEIKYNGNIINAIAEILDCPYFVFMLITGLVGGILSGLTLYSGSLLRKGRIETEFKNIE